MRSRTGIIKEKDNVATTLDELRAGTKTENRMEKIELISRIPKGHKFALKHIDRGGAVTSISKINPSQGASPLEIPARPVV
jgi:altronate hydrolase